MGRIQKPSTAAVAACCSALAVAALGALGRVYHPAYAQAAARGARHAIDLSIDYLPFTIDGRTGTAVAVNGTVSGPIMRLREGDDALVRVVNRLKESTSIHWHGIIAAGGDGRRAGRELRRHSRLARPSSTASPFGRAAPTGRTPTIRPSWSAAISRSSSIRSGPSRFGTSVTTS